MANIVYGAPSVAPVDPAPSWSGMPMTWAAKGLEFSLTDRRTGIHLMPGVRGLGSTTTERHSSASPAVAGSRYEGTSTLDREAHWPLRIWHNGGSIDWMERDRAFWATMDPEDTGVWTVTHPDGKHRSLRLRFVSDGDHARDRNPLRLGWDTYGITLVAEQPFWEGDPVVKSWKNRTYAPFFEPTGPQIVNIAAGSDASTATIDNPGDVESYATWFLDGAMTAAAVGVNGVVVDVPFAIATGECLVIDSDPELVGATMYQISAAQLALPAEQRKKPSARVIGVDLINPLDMSAALGEADFAPIPAGASVPLTLTITGAGAVEALLPTRYRRPW